MQEIQALKDEEKQRLAHDDLYAADVVSAETVEYLKITEEELPAAPQPRAQRQQRHTRRSASRGNKPKLARLIALVALVGLIVTIASSGFLTSSWWAIFLLFPIVKNFQSIQEDRRNGRLNHQTKRSMTRTIFAALFMMMFLTSTWSLMWPLLLIGWGISQVIYRKWQDELYV